MRESRTDLGKVRSGAEIQETCPAVPQILTARMGKDLVCLVMRGEANPVGFQEGAGNWSVCQWHPPLASNRPANKLNPRFFNARAI